MLTKIHAFYSSSLFIVSIIKCKILKEIHHKLGNWLKLPCFFIFIVTPPSPHHNLGKINYQGFNQV